MVVSPERAVPRRNRFVVTTQLAPRLRGWLRGVRGYDARIWRICNAAAALLFAADAAVVDAAVAAAASRSDVVVSRYVVGFFPYGFIKGL